MHYSFYDGITKYIITPVSACLLLASCSTLEKASLHGFNSGYYKMRTATGNTQPVYADVTGEKIDVYRLRQNRPDKTAFTTIALTDPDSVATGKMLFSKNSIDIDLTSVIFKYHPSVYGLPGQLTTEFNIALYAGWRHDTYIVTSKESPLGKRYYRISSRGYDVGIFMGPGTTTISPFTTRNNRPDEYSGMIIQTGVAGFIESDLASFGIALGYDHLLNKDRTIWIYNKKPWMGFVVGIALN